MKDYVYKTIEKGVSFLERVTYSTVHNGFDYLGSMVYKTLYSTRTLESTYFGGGRINRTNTGSYEINYFITDHLGSTRVITNNTGSIKEQNDYYPFGMRHSNANLMLSANRWQFNGKEKQTTANINYMDYGARMYDDFTGRWFVIDPLAEKYYFSSVYAYCVNNPVRAIDFEGKLVIFINGMHNGDGGKADYWGGFDKKIMEHLNDYNSPIYRDGSTGGIWGIFGTTYSKIYSNVPASNRLIYGESQGEKDAPDIINRITDENGNIKETVKIITHSMGAAYAKGYVKALVDYMIKNNIPLEAIAFEADFAPYQPTKQKAVEGVKTYQFTNFHDNIASNGWLLSPYGYIEGAKAHTDFDENKGHSLSDFWEQVQNLPEGKYRIENGQIVPY